MTFTYIRGPFCGHDCYNTDIELQISGTHASTHWPQRNETDLKVCCYIKSFYLHVRHGYWEVTKQQTFSVQMYKTKLFKVFCSCWSRVCKFRLQSFSLIMSVSNVLYYSQGWTIEIYKYLRQGMLGFSCKYVSRSLY